MLARFLAEVERGADCRDGSDRWVQRAEEQTEPVVVRIDVALVEHDHRAGASGGSVVDLDPEEAPTTLDGARM